MSRIGKAPIPVPKGVQVVVSDKNVVTVKGPKGTLMQTIDPAIKVKETEGNSFSNVLRTSSTTGRCTVCTARLLPTW